MASCECDFLHTYVLQAAMTASKKLEKDLASAKKSYSEACAEVERLKAILHQAASAIRASLEVCVYVRMYAIKPWI